MSPTTSPLAKIPPIITNPVYKQFLLDLNTGIDELLQDAGDEAEHRFSVHQDAFNKIIEYVVAYRPLLSQIKSEYDAHIDALRKDYCQALSLNTKLKAMASEPTTLRNYKRRSEELDSRIDIVEKDNARLRRELQELRDTRRFQQEELTKKNNPNYVDFKKDSRLIPGLTLAQATNISFLRKKNRKLDRILRDTKQHFEHGYMDKSNEARLKQFMVNRVEHRDELKEMGERNQMRLEKLKVAVNAANAYNEIKPPYKTVGDLVLYALEIAACQRNGIPLTDEQEELADVLLGNMMKTASAMPTLDDDDPIKDKEAEQMLEYIEKFNELFEDDRYQEAALHAASGHKGILRTMATLLKFKEVSEGASKNSPLLAFCEALMATVPSFGVVPCLEISLECVMCAVAENRLDLLVHWIAKERLTLSPQIGHVIRAHCQCRGHCICTCQALAECVFRHLDCHQLAAEAMLKQGRVYAMVSYSLLHGIYTSDQYLAILTNNYSPDLFHALVATDAQRGQALETGVAMVQLLSMGHEAVCVQYLKDIYEASNDHDREQRPHGPTLQDLVTSDHTTTMDQWNDLGHILAKHHNMTAALELVAAAMVKECMADAEQIVNLVSFNSSITFDKLVL